MGSNARRRRGSGSRRVCPTRVPHQPATPRQVGYQRGRSRPVRRGGPGISPPGCRGHPVVRPRARSRRNPRRAIRRSCCDPPPRRRHRRHGVAWSRETTSGSLRFQAVVLSAGCKHARRLADREGTDGPCCYAATCNISASAPSSIAPATTANASCQADSCSDSQAGPAIVAIAAIGASPTTG